VRDELIAAIENDPDDIENYRVYADWLESNGQPRGQLIAMELMRERLTDRAKREHLARRIAEYFQRNRGTFLAGLKSWPDLRYDTQYGMLRWRHGFIYSAQFLAHDSGDHCARMRELLAAPSGRFLVHVQMGANPAREVLAVLFEKVPASLRRLEVPVDNVDLSSAWPVLARLAHLGVRNAGAVLGTVDLPRLETLVIHGSLVDAIAEARVPALEVLRIESAERHRSLSRLLDELDSPLLEKIELPTYPNTNELVADLSATRIGKQLVELDLTWGQLTDAGAKRWAKSPPPKRLRRLDVRHNTLTKVGIRTLEAVAETVIAHDQDLA
jgi:uncharacterized protein (TIGR02996 family)